MKRTWLLAGAALLAVLGVFLLRDDGRGKKETSVRKKEAPPWSLPPLPRSEPARPAVPTIAAPALPAPREAISGTVRDTKGAPVAGARVSLLADEKCYALAGPDGAFSLVPTLREKRLVLLAEGPAPLAARVVPGIAPGTSGVAIVLATGEATVRGRVLRAKKPVPGARIEASTADWLGRASTDAEGRFVLAGAPVGGLGLVVSADGAIPRVVTVNARPQGPEIEIALEAGTRLEGTVWEKGAPRAGARVILRQGGVPLPFERRETRSDASGHFAFDGIPGAEIRVHARTDDALSAVAVVKADGAHDPDPVRLELGDCAFVVGRVSSGGAPVVGAKVTVEEEGKLEGTTDTEGRFEISPVALGADVLVRVEAKGFARNKLRGRAGEPLDVQIERAAILLVTSSPPAEEISVQGPDAERRVLQWGGVLDDLVPGSTWIAASSPGRAAASRRVELKEGETARVDIDLAPGRVLEGTCVSDDGSPVPGAALSAAAADSGPLAVGPSAASDEKGRFVLRDLGAGRFHVSVAAAGFLEAHAEADESTARLDLVLPRSFSLEVSVTAPQMAAGHSHKKTGQVLVRLSQPGAPPEQRVLAAYGGARASAVFERLRAQPLRVEVFSPGLAPATADVDLRSQSSLSFDLAPGAEASGVVLDPDGKPLPGAALSRGSDPNEDLLGEGAFATVLAMTEGQGEFDCEIAPGGEDVVVTHPEFAPLSVHLSPGGGQKLSLVPGSRIVGRALSKDGAPQGGIGISLEGPVVRRTSTAGDGTFTFKGLLPGSYYVKRHDMPEASRGVEVSVGKRGEVGVDLRAP